MRGLAALSVAVAHADSSIGNSPALHLARWHQFEMPGSAGVEFFFVLSGFVMALMHAGEIGRGGRPLAFLWRRICRIYPAYLAVLGIQLWRFWGAPSLTADAIVSWVTLAPTRTDNLIVVAWTLRQEAVFYLLFALCLLPRVGRVVLAAWVAATAGWWFLGLGVPVSGVGGVVLLHALSPFDFEFFAGLLAGALFRLLPARAWIGWVAFVAGVGIVAARMSADGWGVDYGPAHARVVYGAGYGGVLLGIAVLERAGTFAFRGWRGRLAEAAGAVSYPLYLIHLLVIGWITDALAAAGLVPSIGADACFVLFLTGSVLVSFPFAYGLDRPVRAALRRVAGRLNAGTKKLSAAGV
jgi:peptidoglycan/LPS O-acetylase OafA/YrhL